jgi:hypothetical protein
MIRRGKFEPPPRRDRSAEFASFVARPRPIVAVAALAASVVVEVADRTKVQTYRSEPYRRLVATLPCICCGIERMSQAAHPNTGKGGALKTDDRDCFPLCHEGSPKRCHQRFDQGAMFTKAERREIELLWAHKTRMQLRQLARDDGQARAIVLATIGL